MSDSDILKKAIEKYDIDPIGEVVNKKNGHILKPALDHAGYLYISVYLGNGITKKIKIHRLVAYTYIPNPENLPHINHKNGIRTDNKVSNLEWCNAQYNVSDGFKRGRIIWNKGNASKERIYGYCKKYPRQIFWILTNNNFYFAKAFWGEELIADDFPGEKGKLYSWQFHMQKMVLEDDPIKYLEQFI